MSDTITPYYGEFLVNPAPLEMSGNFCSHSCFYCFANLNKPKRRMDLSATLAILRNHKKNKNLTAQLLQRRYPTVISNHIDPFSKSNYKQFVPLMRLMTEMGLPIMIQTKGGWGVDETLEFLPPSVWYISISHNDERTRKLVEPAAPDLESRFELCRKLVKYGHRVLVGINPCDRRWIPRPEELCAKLSEIGVFGCWVEMLHFHWKQLKNMHPKHKEAFDEDLMKEATRWKGSEEENAFFLRVRQNVLDAGMEVYSINQANPSKFFEWAEYEFVYPTMQGFVNWASQQDFNVFTFEDWCDYFLPRLPDFAAKKDIASYIRSTTFLNQLSFKLPPKMTFKQVFAAAWKNDPITVGAPSQNAGFAIAYNKGNQLFDEKGFPMFYYSCDGIDKSVELELEM